MKSSTNLICVSPCRQNKLEEALLFSGQFTDALQALIDWLYKVEPQLAEDQPVHGDIDLVLNLIDSHKVRLTRGHPQPSPWQSTSPPSDFKEAGTLLVCYYSLAYFFVLRSEAHDAWPHFLHWKRVLYVSTAAWIKSNTLVIKPFQGG